MLTFVNIKRKQKQKQNDVIHFLALSLLPAECVLCFFHFNVTAVRFMPTVCYSGSVRETRNGCISENIIL